MKQRTKHRLRKNTLVQKTLPVISCWPVSISAMGMIYFKHFCLKVDDFVHHDLNPESWLQSPETNLASAIKMAADKIYEHKLACNLIAVAKKSLYPKSALGCTRWNW